MRNHFLSVFRQDLGTLLTQLAPVPPNMLMEEVEISQEETQKVLTTLITNKSLRSDGVHPALLKTVAGIISKPLTDLFNATLNVGKVPCDWKTATVTPIHKATPD